MPARDASSALVAGPLAASSLYSPNRSPTAANTIVVKALVSLSTFPRNSSVVFVSIVCTAISDLPSGLKLVDRPNRSTNLYHGPGRVSRESGQSKKERRVFNAPPLGDRSLYPLAPPSLGARPPARPPRHSRRG